MELESSFRGARRTRFSSIKTLDSCSNTSCSFMSQTVVARLRKGGTLGLRSLSQWEMDKVPWRDLTLPENCPRTLRSHLWAAAHRHYGRWKRRLPRPAGPTG